MGTLVLQQDEKVSKTSILALESVVSSCHFSCFYVIFVPLEYVPTIPPHSTFVIVSCFVIFTNVLVNVDIYGLTDKRTLFFSNNNDDVCTMRRYSRNILQ